MRSRASRPQSVLETRAVVHIAIDHLAQDGTRDAPEILPRNGPPGVSILRYKSAAIYKAHGKLKITFIDGLDIPIALTYANQTSVMRADLKGQMGLAFDFAKISRALHAKPAMFP
jgi:hypothetical protein